MTSLHDIEQIIVDSLLEVSPELMKRFRGSHEVTQKADNSIVTDSDKHTEEILKRKLALWLPASYFLGEENSDISFTEYRKIFDHQYLWVIDPIDGTVNFANGNPFFATSVGLLEKKPQGHTPVAGAVLFPALNELFYTAQGYPTLCAPIHRSKSNWSDQNQKVNNPWSW